MKFYKILSDDLKHYNMQYQEGLNINCEKTVFDSECDSGLFFSDSDHIFEFCKYGTKIAEVIIPENEFFQLCIDGRKYKAAKIILKEIRELWTPETFRWLISQKVNIHVSDDIVLYNAIELGKLDIVRILVENGANIHSCDDFVLKVATNRGHFDIVKYLIEKGANLNAGNGIVLKWAIENNFTEIASFLSSIMIMT